MGKRTSPRANTGRGGRPRKEGDRYECGKLKPPPPNPVVLAQRAALCADPMMATNPIDVMLANRWISEDQHRTACRYREDHNRAQLCGPTVPTQQDLSAPEGVDARNLRFTNMTHGEIAAIWDSAMGRTPAPMTDQEDAQHRALERYKAANRAMTTDQQNEVNGVVLLDSWPQWVIQRRAGRFNTSWERKRVLLLDGLNAMQDKVYEPKRRAAA